MVMEASASLIKSYYFSYCINSNHLIWADLCLPNSEWSYATINTGGEEEETWFDVYNKNVTSFSHKCWSHLIMFILFLFCCGPFSWPPGLIVSVEDGHEQLRACPSKCLVFYFPNLLSKKVLKLKAMLEISSLQNSFLNDYTCRERFSKCRWFDQSFSGDVRNMLADSMYHTLFAGIPLSHILLNSGVLI